MQHVPRQQISLPTGTDIITSLISSSSSLASSDASSEPSSEPTSLPPSSVETSPPPTSEPTSVPPSSEPTLIPQTSNSTYFPPSTSQVPSITTPPPSFAPSSVSPPISENITTIVTSVSGQLTTFTSHLPTSLVESSPNASTSRRTAIIAGTTSGLFILVLFLLVAIFAYRKRKLNKFLEDSGRKKEVKALLDGEEFDDDDGGPILVRSRDRDSVAVGGTSSARLRSGSPTPSLLKSRTSESGSIFREEIWPPPGFVDPISQTSSQVNLSRIVDDVMGPVASEHGYRAASASGSDASHLGMPSNSHDRSPTDASTSSVSSHLSTNSGTPPRPASVTYKDPFRSSPGILSAYYSFSLPPGASPPTPPGSSALASTSISPRTIPTLSARAPISSGGTSYPELVSPPTALSQHQPTSFQPSPPKTSQPKKSSPLARVLTQDARMWLGRPLHHPDEPKKPPAPR